MCSMAVATTTWTPVPDAGVRDLAGTWTLASPRANDDVVAFFDIPWYKRWVLHLVRVPAHLQVTRVGTTWTVDASMIQVSYDTETHDMSIPSSLLSRLGHVHLDGHTLHVGDTAVDLGVFTDASRHRLRVSLTRGDKTLVFVYGRAP